MKSSSTMAKEDNLDTSKDDDVLPDRDVAKEFYAKYEPKEILGRGISSTVRRCIEKETGVEYAAKIIDLSADPENKVSTLEEVRILRLVAGHPFIIQLHDVFESETFIFLVFELCKNGELFDHLTSVVALTEKKTRYIMRQLFEALEHVHNHSVVHRDLKPENILLDDQMNVKLTDFGFARVLKKGEKLMDLCGTPGYLAPEVLRANMFEDATGYGQAVDVWACGVIMYTLLVGCPPFWHRKQMVMLRNIMEGKYSFSSPEWNDISEDPKDLIRKLLIVTPEDRYSVKEALNHSFFHPKLFDQDIEPIKKDYKTASRKLSKINQLTEELKNNPFHARKKFQFIILVVRAAVRISRLKYNHVPALSVTQGRDDPYGVKILRQVIDQCAFKVYGHWVKKSEDQNRAALFENAPRTELRNLYNRMNNLSVT
ncbi:phosphorylase b kinase gamma catalytic chain, skeletal muscle/heart isoform isoform X2 [Diaphorina citri]|uniref:phosphorylase kinase n=1 Tax=Diaphorina citri TaxID=121845 RepID=A0A1S3DUD7_DIACI|nr:phosphorylase b kinase gamma catalytic chain, skeletal muscle/heart isoform isoform X1 [Diaphorina citri]XP_026675714.1 phosphorylase b kinase gamma catalytic chain, skeletal muscle/heart isoform isoform X2 [Diaphorina citri]